MSEVATTPEPPYYSVIFTSILNDDDGQEYEDMADKMVQLASKQEGFLGIESVRNGLGITVSYWKDEDSIKLWKQNSEHQLAQKLGKNKWYQHFKLRVAKVERDYGINIK